MPLQNPPGSGGITDHGALTGLADDDHPQYALDTDLTTHVGAADPHTVYQKESEKGSASGYASLGADGLVPQDQLGTGTQDGTKFLRDDGTWQTTSGGSETLAATIIDAKGDIISATAADTPVRKAVGSNGTFLKADSGQTDGLIWATLADADIPAAIARDSEVTSAISTHEADTSSVHGIADTSTLYRSGGTDVALADGGTGASLVDPNADRILFWDDSAGTAKWLIPGSGLTITDETITASGSPGDLTVVGGCSYFILAADDVSAAAVTNRNVTGFVWTMIANALYVIDLWGWFSPAAATTGIAFNWDTSVAVTRQGLVFYHVLATTGTVSAGDAIADATSRGLSSGTPAAADTPFDLSGIVKCGGTGGTCQLVWRPEVAAVNTLRANTVMKVTRVA